MTDDGAVFKALADPTRRALLDRLRERNGQTLGELCGPLEMARQSATQHLGVLEAANLITTVRRGREKLHYLNPVSLWAIQERWIEKFERPRLRALGAIKYRAEEDSMANRPSYVYVTYIESSPELVWAALTDPDLTAQYWGHSNVSDWQIGSPWEHRRVDGSGIADVAGTVLESVPPRRLTMTFDAPGEAPPGGPSRVTFDIEPYHEIVRLTVTHENLADGDALEAASAGWPAVCANLKSLLETGHVLPRAPWEMHAGLRAAQMARNDPRSGGGAALSDGLSGAGVRAVLAARASAAELSLVNRRPGPGGGTPEIIVPWILHPPERRVTLLPTAVGCIRSAGQEEGSVIVDAYSHVCPDRLLDAVSERHPSAEVAALRKNSHLSDGERYQSLHPGRWPDAPSAASPKGWAHHDRQALRTPQIGTTVDSVGGPPPAAGPSGAGDRRGRRRFPRARRLRQ